MILVWILPLLVNFVLIAAQASKEKVYQPGRAFPLRSLEYLKARFKEPNPYLKWDNQNYLERIASDYASCKYQDGLIEGWANIPKNESTIAFVEYEALEGTTASFVTKHLVPIIDKWVEMPKYHTQIENAQKFACSVNPGCGYNEKRMCVSCVFSPSSPLYVEPDVVEEPPPQSDLPVPSEAEPLPDESYGVISVISNSGATRSDFLENLSILETNCDMLVKDEWGFKAAHTVVDGIGVNIEGFYGRVQIKDDETAVEAANRLLQDLHQAKTPFSKDMRIGCSIIKDCMKVVDGEQQAWLVLSCLYELNNTKYCM